MATLQQLLETQCASGRIPGAAATVSQGGDVEIAWAGVRAVDGVAMDRDALFRIASVTKPILAAATMALIERNTLNLEDPVHRWLPELTEPRVLRAVDGDLSDVVPASRPITVRHLLTFQGGLGLPEQFDLPIVGVLFDELGEGPPRPQDRPEPDEWLRRVAGVPLLHQPGEGWTYNLGYEILGVLLSRAADEPLEDVLADTVFEPVGMPDTSFWTDEVGRLTGSYRRGEDGLELVDPPDGEWTSPPAFPSGGGGLLSTIDDLAAFGRMLLDDGRATGGGEVLTAESVALMMTPHVDGGPEHLFLDGQAWGFGGAVDIRPSKPWNALGRYGWVGGSGTAFYVVPATKTLVVWLSQVELAGPDDFAATADVLTYAVSEDAASGSR